MVRLRRRCRGGRALIDGDAVGVTMDDLPLAVLAAVDVGDAQGVRLERNAVPGHRGVFVADRVGQVATDTRGDKLEAIRGAVGEVRGERAEELAHLVPSAHAPYRPQ